MHTAPSQGFDWANIKADDGYSKSLTVENEACHHMGASGLGHSSQTTVGGGGLESR